MHCMGIFTVDVKVVHVLYEFVIGIILLDWKLIRIVGAHDHDQHAYSNYHNADDFRHGLYDCEAAR